MSKNIIHTEKLNQSVVLNLKVLFKSSVPVCQPGSRPPEPCGVKQQEKSFGRRLAARSRGGRHTAHRIRTRLETNLRDLWRCTITEKAPTRTFSWLKVATNTLRIDQETKLSLNRRKPMDVTLCWRNKYLKGWAVWLAHWAQYPNFSSTYLGLIPVNSILSKE